MNALKNTKQKRDTRLVELVETHNLALALKRLRDTPPYDQDRWKRALQHALGMGGVPRDTQEKIRLALELP